MSINAVSGYANAPPTAPPQQGSAASAVAAAEVKKAPEPAPVVQDIKQPSQQQVEAAVKQVASAIQSKASDLRFSIDNDTGKTIVRITDQKTGEMIRQIPSEELVEIAKSLDKVQGLLFMQKA